MINFKTDDPKNAIHGAALRSIAMQNPFVSDDQFEDTYKQTRLIQTTDRLLGKAGEILRRAAIWLEASTSGKPFRALGYSKKPKLIREAICAEVYRSICSDQAPDWYGLYEASTTLRRALQEKYRHSTRTTSTQAMETLCKLMPGFARESEDQLIDLVFDIERVCAPQFLNEMNFPEK